MGEEGGVCGGVKEEVDEMEIGRFIVSHSWRQLVGEYSSSLHKLVFGNICSTKFTCLDL